MTSSAAPSLTASGLGCTRDDRVLFDALDLGVRPGEVLQVEGRNGAGKTTLLRILTGARRPDAGEVHWCGRGIETLDEPFARNLAYVGHLAGVKRELTPEENLGFALMLHGTQAAMSVREALREVELNGFEDVPTAFLSAGQTRRVALARLLVCPAPLWVLDEPFTALDRHGMELFEGMLDQHLENGGLAVLSTHRPVRLDPGRVVTLDLSAA